MCGKNSLRFKCGVPPLLKLNKKMAFEAFIILKGPPLPSPNVLKRLSTGPMIGEGNFYHNLNENVPPLMGLRGAGRDSLSGSPHTNLTWVGNTGWNVAGIGITMASW